MGLLRTATLRPLDGHGDRARLCRRDTLPGTSISQCDRSAGQGLERERGGPSSADDPRIVSLCVTCIAQACEDDQVVDILGLPVVGRTIRVDCSRA